MTQHPWTSKTVKLRCRQCAATLELPKRLQGCWETTWPGSWRSEYEVPLDPVHPWQAINEYLLPNNKAHAYLHIIPVPRSRPGLYSVLRHSGYRYGTTLALPSIMPRSTGAGAHRILVGLTRFKGSLLQSPALQGFQGSTPSLNLPVFHHHLCRELANQAPSQSPFAYCILFPPHSLRVHVHIQTIAALASAQVRVVRHCISRHNIPTSSTSGAVNIGRIFCLLARFFGHQSPRLRSLHHGSSQPARCYSAPSSHWLREGCILNRITGYSPALSPASRLGGIGAQHAGGSSWVSHEGQALLTAPLLCYS